MRPPEGDRPALWSSGNEILQKTSRWIFPRVPTLSLLQQSHNFICIKKFQCIFSMVLNSTCKKHLDNVFGPQVNQSCRSFDFTLLFEDAFFIMLPAALLLLLLPPKIQSLRRSSVKLTTMRLAAIKTVCIERLLEKAI